MSLINLLFRRAKPGDPAKVALTTSNLNFVYSVLEDIQGVGCRIDKPTGGAGAGWRIVFDGRSTDEETSDSSIKQLRLFGDSDLPSPATNSVTKKESDGAFRADNFIEPESASADFVHQRLLARYKRSGDIGEDELPDESGCGGYPETLVYLDAKKETGNYFPGDADAHYKPVESGEDPSPYQTGTIAHGRTGQDVGDPLVVSLVWHNGAGYEPPEGDDSGEESGSGFSGTFIMRPQAGGHPKYARISALVDTEEIYDDLVKYLLSGYLHGAVSSEAGRWDQTEKPTWGPLDDGKVYVFTSGQDEDFPDAPWKWVVWCESGEDPSLEPYLSGAQQLLDDMEEWRTSAWADIEPVLDFVSGGLSDAGSFSGDVSSLNGVYDGVSSDVSGISDRSDGISGRLSSLSAEISGWDDRLSALEGNN